MRITQCLWKKQFIDKLERKHRVLQDEVEEVFRNLPRYKYVAKGDVKGENLYRALGQTDAGRHLAVLFIHKGAGQALVISARDMDAKERRRYGKK